MPKKQRKQPTPTDAVMEVMKEHALQMPPALCDTFRKDIVIDGTSTQVKIYTPKDTLPSYPVIVYYYGGGWVIANIDVYSASAQGLCELTNAIVVSVEYPKGPENKFPTAHKAAFNAYKWVLANAVSFKGNISKIALVGESAGVTWLQM